MKPAEACVGCGSFGPSELQFETSDAFGDSYFVRRCAECHAFFLSPHPSDQQLARAYDDSYYGTGDSKFGFYLESLLDLFRKQRAALVARYVPDGGSILDVGCGNGRFLKYTLLYGEFHLHGVEIAGRAASRAARIPAIKLKIGTLEESDYADGSFDAVSLFHVLEHLPEPARTLRTVTRILKRGGVCVISFPNIESIQAKIFRGKWLHLDPPRHLSYWSPSDFVRFVAGLGMVAERMSFLSPEQNPFGMIQSLLNCTGAKRDLLYEFLKKNRTYIADVSPVTLAAHLLFSVIAFPVAVLSDLVESALGRGATVQMILRKA